jgi:hypothetical protein
MTLPPGLACIVDGADEGGDVGAELGEFLVLAGDRLPELGDGGAEPGLVAVVPPRSLMRS